MQLSSERHVEYLVNLGGKFRNEKDDWNPDYDDNGTGSVRV